MKSFDDILTFASVVFLTALIVLLGFIYFADRADAATLYENTTNDAAQVTTGFATGYQLTNTAACIDRIDLLLSRIGTVTSSIIANIRYGETPVYNTTNRTSTNAYSFQDIDGTATTTSFFFSPCVNVPQYQKAWVVLNTNNHSGLSTRIRNTATTFGWGGLDILGNWSDSAAGNVNSSTLPVQTWYGTGENIATGNETVEFRFPTDGLSQVPNFSNWVLLAEELNASKTYYLSVTAYLATSTVSTTENGMTFTDITSFIGATSTNFFAFPKSRTLTPVGDGERIWILEAKVCGEPYCFIPLDSHEITITTNYPGEIPDTPYASLAGPFENPDDYLFSENGERLTREQVDAWAAGNWCTDTPGDWTDFGGGLSWGLCRLSEVLFKPSDMSKDFLLDQALTFKKIFPFRYVFDAADSANSALSAAKDDASLDLTLDMTTAFGRTATFALLTSSTLSGIAGEERKNDIFEVERYVIWLATIGIIFTVLVL